MPTILSDSLRQIGAIWKRLSNPSRVAVVSTLILALGGLLFVTFWAQTPSLVVLESDLDAVRASRIADALDGLNVTYETRDGGRTILVPAGEIGRLRLKLAGQGVVLSDQQPEEGKSSPWEDKAQRQARQTRRLQADVERAIEALKGVHQTTVMIAPARDSPYSRSSRPPRASITVFTEGGRPLAAYQVEGIVSIVTNAVSGLTSEGVNVIDGEGRRLTRRKSGSGGLVDDDLTAYREAWERDLEAKLAEVLDGVVGPGSYRCAVWAQISFDKTRTTRTEYDSENRVLESEESKKETSPVPGGASASAGALSKTEEKTRKYRVPVTETEEIRSTPQILRITAGVLIDEDRAPADLEALKDVLVRAIGIADPDEDFSISKTAFAELVPVEDVEEASSFDLDGILEIAKYVAAGLVGLGLLLFFRGAFRRPAQGEAPARTGTQLDLTVGDEELSEERVPPKLLERQRLKKEIARAIDQDPRGVAKLIEMWLHEEGA